MTVKGFIERVKEECIFPEDTTDIKFSCNGRMVEVVGFDKAAGRIILKLR